MIKTFQRWIDQAVEIPVIGIDLGDTSLKAVEIVRAKDQIKLRNAVSISIENNPPAQILRQFLKEYGIKTKNAALGLASPELIVRSFHFPHMSQKELRGAVMIEAEQTVLSGHDLSEMIVDWYPPDSQDPDPAKSFRSQCALTRAPRQERRES